MRTLDIIVGNRDDGVVTFDIRDRESGKLEHLYLDKDDGFAIMLKEILKRLEL